MVTRRATKIVEEIRIITVLIKRILSINLLKMVQSWVEKNKILNIKVLIMELFWVEK